MFDRKYLFIIQNVYIALRIYISIVLHKDYKVNIQHGMIASSKISYNRPVWRSTSRLIKQLHNLQTLHSVWVMCIERVISHIWGHIYAMMRQWFIFGTNKSSYYMETSFMKHTLILIYLDEGAVSKTYL